MLIHNFKITLRSFQKSKSSFIINILGLSAGLLCTLLIFLWVQNELSIDRFHKDEKRVFRAMEHQRYANGDIMTTWSTPGVLAAELKKEIPEIEYASAGSWTFQHLISFNEKSLRLDGLYADQDFFEIFTFPIKEGNKDVLLQDLNSIVVSEHFAEMVFGQEKALGKTIQLDKESAYKVTGVFYNVPASSSMKFDYVLSAEKWRKDNEWLRQWDSNGPRTYVKLKENTDYHFVNEKISDFIKQRNEGSVVELFLYPYADAYLYGRFENAVLTGGRIEYVQLFSIIALFVLLIACINFMNLSTAKASRKAKEVGIRKALGAHRKSLIQQYLFESFFLTAASIFVAIAIIPLIIPYFNEITGKELSLTFNANLVFGLLIILLVTGLFAGSYPALYLSAFQPVKVLKNEIKSSWGELWARRGLVVFQFGLSIFLIIAVTVVYSQIQFVQDKNLGYKKENLIMYLLEGKLSGGQNESFTNELKALPGVINASVSGHDFIGRNNNTGGLSWPGKLKDEVVLFENFRGNHTLIETMGIEMKEGRSFSKDFSTDTSAIIFNETAIRLMRIEDPIGTKVNLWGQDRKIVGVTKDFHFQSFRSEVSPGFFILDDNVWFGQARLRGDMIAETIEAIKKLHEEFNPGFSFEYSFQDENYDELYTSERRVASISQYFAGFAILISCLGLFGLASFTAERRIKEIGIRKVLGASVRSLVFLLTNEFTRLVIIAILISIPIAWWVSKNWLEEFAYHIELSWVFFLLAGILALLVALITVSSQAWNAANVNPVDTLKDE
ncbi:MAG: FtsX-like permease family protein [Cytophagales bacterium]